MRKLFWGALLCAILAGALAVPSPAAAPKEVPPAFPAYSSVEAWRIRIDNEPDGPIEVSMDRGFSWRLIGRVMAPATRTLMGYLAAGYAPIGCVAATAVHGIRIRVGDLTTAYPPMINIVPRQFAQTLPSFGGQVAGVSGIYTDIPAGISLFREFAPYAGSRAYLQGANGHLSRVGASYTPSMRDIIVIIVRRPVTPLRELDFENRKHGRVTAVTAGGEHQIVASVTKPVLGVGRFDGTSYTGVGAINTNHMCVITISTAPITKSRLLEGVGPERRGGFQIEPGYHNSQTDEAGSPQTLVVGRTDRPSLEGTPPLFFGYLDLSYFTNDHAHSWICDVRVEGESAWRPMPQIVGNKPYIFRSRRIVAFRLRRPRGDEDSAWLAKRLLYDAGDYDDARRAVARAHREEIARGSLSVDVPTTDQQTSYVQLYVDGQMAGLTNARPFSLVWDTRQVPDGEHLVEARAIGADGSDLSSVHSLVYVDNARRLR